MRLNKLNQLILGRELIEGTWWLTPRHEVQYRRRRENLRSSLEEEVVLRGNLIAAEKAKLVISAWERRTGGELVSRSLTLKGRWEADSKNRLNFLAQRQEGREDRLTLSGGWEVNDQNEILYRYERLDERNKKRKIDTLTFRGSWQVDGNRQLTYILDRDSESAFRFRGTFQTASLQEKGGNLRYQIGVEVKGKERIQTITLSGKWKLSRNLGLELELASGSGEKGSLTFGATYSTDSGRFISAKLTTRQGKPLGAEIILTQEFLKGQGEVFLRLRKSLEESALEGGARIRW